MFLKFEGWIRITQYQCLVSNQFKISVSKAMGLEKNSIKA